MPELLIEALTEEIPARMQARAAEDLCRLLGEALKPIAEGAPRGFSGPRRIGLVMEVAAGAETPAKEERGPRVNAPEQALAGFLKKHGVAREALVEQGGFWVLMKPGGSVAAAELIAEALPGILWEFPWPKSMRWGTSGFLWVRPLQRILCVLDGAVVPFALARGEDAAHGIASGNLTEGHRVHAPGAVAVTGHADYVARLRERRVVVDAAERSHIFMAGIRALAAAEGLELVPDAGLEAEVAGLVEWPVPLLGSIDDAFMDLPAEVLRTSMRVNQRYFALRHPDGRAASRFALVANIAASDGGAALVAGNERVLRARLSDARFFWDQDRKQRLEEFLPKLDGVTFHAKLGTQGQRVERLARLARQLAPMVGADADLAERAARLCKADLASGMVGEFPELQGIMGGYYARADYGDLVANAIAQHYRPLGPGDAVPTGSVALTLALDDKFDQVIGFFAVSEKPTGSSDPFAVRRSGLGIVRIIREQALKLRLRPVLEASFDIHIGVSRSIIAARLAERRASWWAQAESTIDAIGDLDSPENPTGPSEAEVAQWEAEEEGLWDTHVRSRYGQRQEVVAEVLAFLLDRLRVQLRAEGARHDLVAASIGEDDDILSILARADALKSLVESEAGTNLLAAYKRAQNILRIEEKKDGPHSDPVDEAALAAPEEQALNAALARAERDSQAALAREDFGGAMTALAELRAPTDAFFEKILVNDPAFRKNRLRLLSRLRAAMDAVADLSKIEA